MKNKETGRDCKVGSPFSLICPALNDDSFNLAMQVIT
jgi:hypothetical protein